MYRLQLADFVPQHGFIPTPDLGFQDLQLQLVLDHLLAGLQKVRRRGAVGGVSQGLPGLQLGGGTHTHKPQREVGEG